jgi:prepilin-type N-terminal cleavage/methylation domain-containing protein
MQTGETTIRTRRSQVRRLTLGAGLKRLGRPWAPQGGGFTLTEIMIAMGVLAVGMGMVAGALHAGIQVHLRTIDDIMRQLIGDNSLAMVQARVRHSTTNGITDTYKLLDSTYFGPGDLKYPCDPQNTNPNTPYGAAVLMKRRPINANVSPNDYDVLIVPYRIVSDSTTIAGITVVPKEMTPCTVAAGTTASSGSMLTVPAGLVNVSLRVGSVVIDNRSGQVSFVRSIPTASTTKAELANTLTAGNGSGVKLTTLAVTPTTNNNRLECSKPVQTKTALSPAPGWAPGGN